MRIRKDIDFRLSLASASDLRSPGCSLHVCVYTAAKFEASPRESGVISGWERGPSSSWCWGAVAESIVVLCHS